MTRLLVDALVPQGAGPDILWNGESGDMALAPLTDPGNPAGLVARNPLLTALVMSLESDARGPRDPLDPSVYDQRGWPGDGFDVDTARGEAPLGSTTWVAFRHPTDDENAQRVVEAAQVALKPLQDQGVIGDVTVEAEADPAETRIRRSITIARPDGSILYSGPFSGLWEALGAGLSGAGA
ncbi:phage GP46 family protein [Bosea massiliensis]|uniref:Phage GP46 family protein n=1 Tax=Bosea massiliensis TaxID=151419 RepID=A0ABW0NYC6_9HYPH